MNEVYGKGDISISNSEHTKWYKFLVEAEISLLPHEFSGRKGGITSGYQPNHNFGPAENSEMRMGVITVPNNEWIMPGESCIATVEFLMPEGYVIDLVPGLTWRIQEGGRHVGNGKVIYSIDEDKD